MARVRGGQLYGGTERGSGEPWGVWSSRGASIWPELVGLGTSPGKRREIGGGVGSELLLGAEKVERDEYG